MPVLGLRQEKDGDRNIDLYPGYFNRSGAGNGMGFRNGEPLAIQLNLPTE